MHNNRREIKPPQTELTTNAEHIEESTEPEDDDGNWKRRKTNKGILHSISIIWLEKPFPLGEELCDEDACDEDDKEE